MAATGSASNANTDCATARYSTVQSAVTAAEAAKTAGAPTIEICPGTYQEQVTITKSLNVTHAPRSGRVTIEGLAAPAGSTSNCQATDTSSQVPQSVLEICAPKPAWVRPVDIYSFAAAIHPQVSGNRYDGKPYNP